MNNELFKPSCDHSLSLSFPSLLPEKQVHAVFDPRGRKAPLKERWRGSIWGQKTTKRPLLLWFWCYVTPRFAMRKASTVRNLFIATPFLLIFSLSPSPFLFPCHCKCQPLPPDSPPSLSLSLPPSRSVTLPFISFKGEGRHLILGYLPISMMAASLIISHLLLISASTLARWHRSFNALLLLFNVTFFTAGVLIIRNSLVII